MKAEIRRIWETDKSVCGELWLDGIMQCYTLEPARVNPVIPGHPCIPAGIYKVILSHSPHLGYNTPEVLDVPGRSGIRWHVGNKPADVLGCAAVGQTHAEDWVGESDVAFNKLMGILALVIDDITVFYTDPQEPQQ